LLNDYTERINLAANILKKLKELQALFDDQAQKYHIYPFIDWEDVLKGRIHHTDKPPVDPSK